LYRSFISRWPEDEPALTAWIVDNTENPYEPFGSAVHGKSRSQAELLVFHAARARIASKNIDAEEERARIAQVARAARGTMNLYNAVRRGDLQALKALIETGADWRQVVREKGSLVKLAEEKGRSLVIEYLKSIGVE